MVHIATVLGGPGSPSGFVSSVVNMNCNLLETAAKDTSVKRFVYTSSSEPAVYTSVDQPDKSPVALRSWNELTIARAQGVSSLSRVFDVYAARKALGEQVIWKWMQEHQPGFVANIHMGFTLSIVVYDYLSIFLPSPTSFVLWRLDRSPEPGTSVVFRVAGGYISGQYKTDYVNPQFYCPVR